MNRLITADASKVSPSEFLDALFGPSEPKPVRDVRRMIAAGDVEKALSYLNACNSIQRAFGHPEYEMPGDLGLTDVVGDPLKRRAA